MKQNSRKLIAVWIFQSGFFFLSTFLSDMLTFGFIYESLVSGFKNRNLIEPHFFNWLPWLLIVGGVGLLVGLALTGLPFFFISSNRERIRLLVTVDLIWLAFCWWNSEANRSDYGFEKLAAPIVFAIVGMILFIPLFIMFAIVEKENF